MVQRSHLERGGSSGTQDHRSFQDVPEQHKTFVITVDQAPTLAGIDPYNKLLDRNADDNMIDVTKQ